MKETKLEKVIQLVLIVLLIALFCIPMIWASHDIHHNNLEKTPKTPQNYALTVKVVSIDRENDIVTFEDCNGFLWQILGVEDWEVEDGASLLMDSNGTEEIFDDVIISARFNNWTITK